MYLQNMQFHVRRRTPTVHRIGIIGASAHDRAPETAPTAVATSWAVHSHVPAIAAAPTVTLTAVATTRIESAERSARAFGARHAFASAAELAACDEVDLVVVSVRSPGHAPAVETALKAGKPVWCEWPIGPGGQTTQRLARLARDRGLTAIAGLQGRFTPAVAYARRLLDDGYIGQVLSAHAYAEYDAWGETIAVGYSADEKANAHILVSGGGHILDILTYLTGEIRDVSGTLSYQFASGYALDRQQRVSMTAPDQFTAHGTLQSGAVFSAHVLGAAPHGLPFQLHITGTRGQLVLETDGMPQIAPLTLKGAQGDNPPTILEIPPPYLPTGQDLHGPAVAMAAAYRQLPDDLSLGAGPLPDFNHGLKIHRLLNAITVASRSGTRQNLPTNETQVDAI
jgi:predicted dehydrogenase